MNSQNNRKMMSTFEVLGSYFVDAFYNGLYLNATSKTRNGLYASITDAYKIILHDYKMGIQTPKLYVFVILKLHEYYSKHMSAVLGMGEFEDMLIRILVPETFQNEMSNKQKEAIIRRVITAVVIEFCNKLSTVYLRKIIDDHANRANIPLLQDTICAAFVEQRELIFAEFLAKVNDSKKPLNSAVFDRLKAVLLKQTRRCCALEATNADLEAKVRDISAKYNKLTAYITTNASRFAASQASQASQAKITQPAPVPAQQQNQPAQVVPQPSPVESSQNTRMQFAPQPVAPTYYRADPDTKVAQVEEVADSIFSASDEEEDAPLMEIDDDADNGPETNTTVIDFVMNDDPELGANLTGDSE